MLTWQYAIRAIKKSSRKIRTAPKHIEAICRPSGKSRQSRRKQGKDSSTSNPILWEQRSLPLFATAESAATNTHDDLQRQVAYMQSLYPKAEIIRDIGSGLNFKRKGLRSLLDRLMRGDQLEIVVACRDRLTRFGFELIEYMVEQNGGKIVVLDQSEHCPESELVQDILAIIHVFSCRLHGLRKYGNKIKKDKDLSQCRTEKKS